MVVNESIHPLRYERKLIPRGYAVAEVLAAILRHPAVFRETYQARAINNIYFDTAGLGDYQDHVSGAAHRVKTRIRWYGRLCGHIARPFLERKAKFGAVGTKQRYELPSFCFDGEKLHIDLQELLNQSTVPGGVREQMLERKATLVNRYHRRYFASADRSFRLTVDTDLEFYGVGTLARKLSALARSAPPVIIELKYDLPAAERAEGITNQMPFRVERCSKYIMGMQALFLL
jgi:hypothetical protein